jgi:predicted PhzF superfamily epimerase YddE/YHI9
MLQFYQVDAFTDTKFKGNPAAVILLNEWPEDKWLQNIAMELNLSETAFLVSEGEDYMLRWFTPSTEVKLCGHATLSAAHILFKEIDVKKGELSFKTLHSGILKVRDKGESYEMDFPIDLPRPCDPDQFNVLTDQRTSLAFEGREDLLLILKDSEAVKNCTPDIGKMKLTTYRTIIVSAPGENYDFVSRVFAPNCGIDEDPVTGSAHTLLTAYWAERLGVTSLSAYQMSKRGGYLYCTVKGERVLIEGKAVTTIKGEIL